MTRDADDMFTTKFHSKLFKIDLKMEKNRDEDGNFLQVDNLMTAYSVRSVAMG